jgi:hypothetical protein
MADTFHVRVFCLTHPSDRQDFEEIRQDVEVDGGRRFRVLKETSSWTRDGDLMMALEYVELDDKAVAEERY